MDLIILLAPPCGGKGTQTHLLKTIGYKPISIGYILRTEYSNNEKIVNLLKAGNMVSDEIIHEILKNHLKDGKYIFDGFPRVKEQAIFFKKHYSHLSYKVILLDVPKEILLKRMKNRHNCYECGKVFSFKALCCKKITKKRNDDNITAFQKRLNKYNNNIKEILEILKKNIIKIDGTKDILTIFQKIKNKIR